MDWIVDRGSPQAAERTLERVESHLRGHAAIDAGVPEAVRSVRDAVRDQPGGTPLRLHLEWPRLTLFPVTAGEVAEGAVPLRERAGLGELCGPEVGAVDLDLERRRLDSFVDGPPPMPPVDLDPGRDGAGAAVVALLAAVEAHPSATPAQAACLAGTALADSISHEPPATASEAATLFVDLHRALGGEAVVLGVEEGSFEVGVTSPPFARGAAAHPAIGHVSTGIAGRLAARAAGTALVEVEESVAFGDDECRIRVGLGADVASERGELHRWPPIAPQVEGPAPHLDLSVSLPSESGSVPVVRRLAAQALRAFGVDDDDIHDVQLAITEACANVVDHANDSKVYEVRFELAADRCAITVLDQGEGFDASAVSEEMDVTAEQGRGLALMRALVDSLAFHSEPQDGAVVHMVKTLRYDDGHPLRQGAR